MIVDRYLDVAQEYHYKNRVISLNGLGNIYMTFGNYEQAEQAFRLALAGGQALSSTIGQAINCANLGAIFERQGQIDSAWVYFRRSMKQNQAAGSTLRSTEHTKPSTPLPQSWNRRLLRARSKRREPARLTSSVRGTNLAGSLYSLVSLG